MIQRSVSLASTVLLAALLGACATASYQKPPLPPQNVEVSRPDVARVYLMREGQLRGKVRGVRVEEGDHEIGALDQNDFLCWERAPGRSLIAVKFESGLMEGGDHEALFKLDAEAGRAYYLVVHVDRHSDKPELSPRAGQPEIEAVAADEGRALVKARRPVPVK